MEASFEPVVNLITQTGVWCVTAYILGRHLLREKQQDRQDNKEEKERLYRLIENQGKILEQQKELLGQQKELLSQQVKTSQDNNEMLERLTSIQMIQTNRLDRVEERQTKLEEEIKELSRILQNKIGE